MGVIAIFNPAGWRAAYPEFALVSDAAAQNYYAIGSLYFRNDGGGPVALDALQLALVNMVTSHVAWLMSPTNENGQPDSVGTAAPSPLVGRIKDASEGSVSVGTEYATATPGSMAWFTQTKYGAMFWQATAAYRTSRYMLPVQRNMNPWPGVGGGAPGPGWPFT